jgi:hypothetical protein
MTDSEQGTGEETIDDEGRNPTQQRLDREGVSDAPVDVPWSEEDER